MTLTTVTCKAILVHLSQWCALIHSDIAAQTRGALIKSLGAAEASGASRLSKGPLGSQK